MNKRILAIGIQNLPQSITQKSWQDALLDETNISDYDVVFINFLSLPQYKAMHTPNIPDSIVEDKYSRQLNTILSEKKILESLKVGVQLFLFINYDHRVFIILKQIANLTVFAENGEIINLENPEFNFYFSKLKKWTFCFDICPKSGKVYLNFEIDPLAKNKAGNLLGVRLHKFLYHSIFLSSGVDEVYPGSIYMLHSLECDVSTEILPILHNICKYSLEKTEPEWSKQIECEKMQQIKKEITRLEQSQNEIQIKINDQQQMYTKLSEYKKLLWATGHPLEDIIHKCLNNVLNLQPSKPQKGEDDGIFEYNSITYIMEIKSGENRQARFEELSKLIARMNKLKENNPQRTIKGIFIMNHFANLPLDKRGEPFSNQIKEHARIEHIILLTTSQFYSIIIDCLHDKIKKDDAIDNFLNSVY